MGRIKGNDAANITQAGISSIVCNVFDLDSRSMTPLVSPAMVVADNVFDTLQTDDRWTVDDTGYNFRHEMPASTFADGDKIYRVEYKFTPASGAVFWAVFDCYTINVRSN